LSISEIQKIKRVISNEIYEISTMKKPIIIAKTSGIKEICKNRMRCFLCRGVNSENSIKQRLEFKNGASLKKEMFQNNFELFQKKFILQKIEKIKLIYEGPIRNEK
jgi:alpha-D-ribose 1-methylphosphonate 5-triphosphate synthase subunit PhnH